VNVPDAQLLDATIRAVVLERPPVELDYPQHLCLDKDYDNPTGWETAVDHDETPHIRLIRDERPKSGQNHEPRREQARCAGSSSARVPGSRSAVAS
jgi:hypothetical protein